MSHIDIKKNLINIQKKITSTLQAYPHLHEPTLVAVSKRQPYEHILCALQAGLRDFGENFLQEAQERWLHIRTEFPDLKLHYIGHIQSNKVKDIVALFDVIHTVDREKVARRIAHEMVSQNKNISCFIQVNIGKELQKSGVMPEDFSTFYKLCHDDLGLPIQGVMSMPPAGQDPEVFFHHTKQIADQFSLPNISMGMSQDYVQAIRAGATHIRIGEALLGKRQ